MNKIHLRLSDKDRVGYSNNVFLIEAEDVFFDDLPKDIRKGKKAFLTAVRNYMSMPFEMLNPKNYNVVYSEELKDWLIMPYDN